MRIHRNTKIKKVKKIKNTERLHKSMIKIIFHK